MRGVTTLSSILAAAASLALFLTNTTTAYAATLHHLWNQTILVAAQRPPSGGSTTNSGIGIGDDEPLPNETNTGNPYRWQAHVADTNTLHGNKLTTVPLVGWQARGGMPVQFTLYHNSKATINRELGQKWSHTYLLYLLVDSQTGNVTVHWGDGKCYTFIRQPNGSYLPPAGIYDTLVANGSPISSYDLTTKEQIRYRFTNPNGTGWFCTSITDPNGNTTTFSVNADDQLLSTSGGFNNSYSYNANGEQVSRVLDGVSYTLSWDYDGQLVGISGNGSVVTFSYDALGRRVLRTVNGTTCQLVHDGDRIILERQGGTVTAVYSYGNALIARNGEVVLPDGLGTTRATVNSLQALTSTLTTEAFGNAVAQWGSSGNPYRFAGAWGYRDDGDAGLLHVGARYYDPQVGRFVSADDHLDERPYLYCDHDPVNYTDSDGAKKKPVKPVKPGKPGKPGGNPPQDDPAKKPNPGGNNPEKPKDPDKDKKPKPVPKPPQQPKPDKPPWWLPQIDIEVEVNLGFWKGKIRIRWPGRTDE